MKPILFNTEMVGAILEDRKTVTRRKIDRDITNFCDVDTDGTLLDYHTSDGEMIDPIYLCRYKVGDILYVRETFGKDKHGQYQYRTDYPEHDCKPYPIWKPSIHMPKEAARIFLKVTDIRVERLQDITEEQAIKEGFEQFPCTNCRGFGCCDCSGSGLEEPGMVGFVHTWDNLYEKRGYGWEANPWVWVIEFERVEV